ncbi:MAG TPA: hypothetical protein P5341_08635 [Hyphomonas sp.]|nr:hypothetical protein [Hyphomonas sp.]
MDIRVIEFKTVFKGEKSMDMVHVAASDAFTETGQLTHSTWHRVKDLIPPEHEEGMRADFMRARWATIEPFYTAWKEGNEIPEIGTPLAAWSGLTQAQAEALRRIQILTVEGVRDMTEAQIGRLNIPNPRALKVMAADYLDGRDKAGLIEEMQRLREQNEAMLAMLAEKEPEKPRRGRPPKADAA